ncbi:ComF family protein [Luteococcus sp. Sow4_B9]|uniref:ComF family protein n=1 Tax=Luteococcus sp. Sow4_B9 TaxID=3438792 RepID=UPI003F9D0959
MAAAGDYREPLRSVLSAHKDRGAWGLSGVLSTQLARAVRLVLDDGPQAPGFVGGEGPICLVPVPSSPRQVRARGYDHAMALARRAARNLGQGPHSVRVRARAVLRRVGSVADQSTLGRGARIRNQAGSMRARTAPRGASAVVVDDICTTGSSLAEAFRALDEAGWRVLGGAVVAHPSRGGQQCGKPPCEIVQVPLDCL